MKAVQIKGYGDVKSNLQFVDIAKPIISDHEVLIEIHAASVNPIDYKIIEGAMKQVQKLDFPAPIGFDVAGKIVELGQQVTEFKLGDEVFARVPSDKPGTFAEYIAVDQSAIALKPSNMSYEEAASIPLVGLTTLQCLEIAKIKSGDRVLIHAGSGGVGSFAIQYAKALGAKVYTTTSTKNVAWVKALGANRVIDYKKEDYLEIAKDLDIVFDTLGGNYTQDAFQIIKAGGTVVSIAGKIDEETAVDLGFNILIRWFLAFKRRKITNLAQEKSATYRFLLMNPSGKELNTIKKMIEDQKIKAVIDSVFPFEKSIEAIVEQKTGRAQGKIIIKMK